MSNFNKLILCSLIFLLSCKSTADKVKVDKYIQPHFDYIVMVLDKNKININYRKIKYVKLFGLKYARGFYYTDPKVIFIDPEFRSLDRILLHKKLLILMLAHEMAHSQDIDHNSDSTSVMNKDVDKYLLDIIKNQGIEQPIIDTFKLKDK